MKKVLSLNFIFLFLISITLNTAKSEDKFYFGGGVYLGYKGSVNIEGLQSGRKMGYAFNPLPEMGGSVDLLLLNNIGVIVDIGLTSSSYETKGSGIIPGETRIRSAVEKHKYITFNPKLYIFGFTLGLNISKPVSSSYDYQSGLISENIKNIPIPTSVLSTLMEIHLGGKINLFETGLGKLYLKLDLDYPLTGIYSDYAKDDPLKKAIPPEPGSLLIDPTKNPKPASFTIGLNYMFNILKF